MPRSLAFAFASAFIFYGLWLAWVLAAYSDGMFSVTQMQNKGFQKGIPLEGHWAMMWADLILPILLFYLIGKYSEDWSFIKIGVLLMAGMGLSHVLHLTYIKAGMQFPEAPTYGGELKAAGWLHLLYMGIAFGVIALFYIASIKPTPFDVSLTTAWLIVHVIIGVHVPLKILKPDWFPYHGIADAGTLLPILGTMAVLTGLSFLALR
jgi:hypothetical protein